VIDEVLAHMSVQNEPMSEETVNALQVFSTFKGEATVQLVREIQKQKYHLKSTEMYLGNSNLPDLVKILKSRNISYSASSKLQSKVLRRMLSSEFT
jgi:hypothetical protein